MAPTSSNERLLPNMCVAYSGPGDYRHRGGPGRDRVWRIRHLTHTDARGTRYYRTAISEGWRRLRTADDFVRLNESLDSRM